MAEPGMIAANGEPVMGVDSTGAARFIRTNANGELLVEASGSNVTYTDKSGTITLGGTAQTLAAINASRTGMWIQNQSNGDLWISSVGAAAGTQPSMWLPPGSFYEFPETGVPTTAISIFGATTGQAFAAREW